MIIVMINIMLMMIILIILMMIDENYDGKQEFVVATNLTTAGSAEDKLRWAFRMYDKDGSGKLNSIKLNLFIISNLFIKLNQFVINQLQLDLTSIAYSRTESYHNIIINCHHHIHCCHHYNHQYKPRPRNNRHGGTCRHCRHIL